jgi:uncharacterized membrane protein YraQ (UPF0718 family)
MYANCIFLVSAPVVLITYAIVTGRHLYFLAAIGCIVLSALLAGVIEFIDEVNREG